MSKTVKENKTKTKKAINNEKGAITVFLLLIFLGVFALSTLLVEGSRIKSANAILKRGTDLSIRSTLAGFDTELKETYGIFSFNSSLAHENTRTYLESNLDFSQEGIWDPYKFKIEKFELQPKHSLMDPKIVERQILEYMKYRGLVSIGEEVYEKLEAYFAIGKTAPLLKREQKIDREINNIGKIIRALKKSIDKHNQFNITDLENIKTAIKEGLVFKKKLKEAEEELFKLGQERGRIRINLGSEASSDSKYIKLGYEIDELGDVIRALNGELNKLNIDSKYSQLRQEELLLDQMESAIEVLMKKSKSVKGLINTADTKMDATENVLSGFRDKSKVKHEDYRDILSESNLEIIKIHALNNKTALESLIELYENPPWNITESSANSIVNNIFSSNYKSNILYEIPKGNGSTTIMVGMDRLDGASESSLNELKKLFDSIKNVSDNFFVEDKKYLGTLPSKSVESDFELKQEKREDISGFLVGFKATDISGLNGEPPNFDEAEKNAEGAVDIVASIFEDADINPDKKEIIDGVFDRNGLSGAGTDFRDTLLVNEYIMLMFNNRTTQYNEKAFFKECEVEYIIYGSRAHQTNANFAYAEISAHRLVTNVLSLYSCAPKTMGVVRQLATALAAWSGGLTYLGWEVVVAGVYSSIEAGIDTYELTQGNSIAFIKEDKHFLLGGPGRLTDLVRKFIDTDNPESKAIVKSKEKVKGILDNNQDVRLNLNKSENDLNATKPFIENGKTTKSIPLLEVDYEDYLRFIIVGRELLGKKNELIGRIQNLYHINMNEIKNEGEAAFDLSEMFTYLYVDVNASIKSMFFSGKGIEGAEEHISERRTINSKIMHGY